MLRWGRKGRKGWHREEAKTTWVLALAALLACSNWASVSQVIQRRHRSSRRALSVPELSVYAPGFLAAFLSLSLCVSLSLNGHLYRTFFICRYESQIITGSICRRLHSPSCWHDSLPRGARGSCYWPEVQKKTWWVSFENGRKRNALIATDTLVDNEYFLESSKRK